MASALRKGGSVYVYGFLSDVDIHVPVIAMYGGIKIDRCQLTQMCNRKIRRSCQSAHMDGDARYNWCTALVFQFVQPSNCTLPAFIIHPACTSKLMVIAPLSSLVVISLNSIKLTFHRCDAASSSTHGCRTTDRRAPG